jgi:hypothetical protein
MYKSFLNLYTTERSDMQNKKRASKKLKKEYVLKKDNDKNVLI